MEEKEEEEKRNIFTAMKRWKKCSKLVKSFFDRGREKNREKKTRKRGRRQPKVWWTLGNSGNRYPFLLMIGQSWVGANAASEETLCRSEPMTRMQQEMEVKESSWEQVIPKRPHQGKR